jgi:hypothetical protein
MILQARRRAMSAVNTELWRIGEHISKKIDAAEWGEGVVEKLARHIQRHHPNPRGFTRPNLYRMRQFYEAYRGQKKASALLRQLPLTHNLIILSQSKLMGYLVFRAGLGHAANGDRGGCAASNGRHRPGPVIFKDHQVVLLSNDRLDVQLIPNREPVAPVVTNENVRRPFVVKDLLHCSPDVAASRRPWLHRQIDTLVLTAIVAASHDLEGQRVLARVKRVLLQYDRAERVNYLHLTWMDAIPRFLAAPTRGKGSKHERGSGTHTPLTPPQSTGSHRPPRGRARS